MEKNDTHAVISGNTLRFGDQDGTMTLICAAVNADTNVIVEKKIIIHNGLAVGDEVILIRQQEGQKFIVVDRIG